MAKVKRKDAIISFLKAYETATKKEMMQIFDDDTNMKNISSTVLNLVKKKVLIKNEEKRICAVNGTKCFSYSLNRNQKIKPKKSVNKSDVIYSVIKKSKGLTTEQIIESSNPILKKLGKTALSKTSLTTYLSTLCREGLIEKKLDLGDKFKRKMIYKIKEKIEL